MRIAQYKLETEIPLLGPLGGRVSSAICDLTKAVDHFDREAVKLTPSITDMQSRIARGEFVECSLKLTCSGSNLSSWMVDNIDNEIAKLGRYARTGFAVHQQLNGRSDRQYYGPSEASIALLQWEHAVDEATDVLAQAMRRVAGHNVEKRIAHLEPTLRFLTQPLPATLVCGAHDGVTDEGSVGVLPVAPGAADPLINVRIEALQNGEYQPSFPLRDDFVTQFAFDQATLMQHLASASADDSLYERDTSGETA